MADPSTTHFFPSLEFCYSRRMRFAGLILFLVLLSLSMESRTGEFPVADRVVVEKSERKLHLMKDGEAFRTFRIALGIRPVGDKEYEGDFKTPEGSYLLDARNPNSEYFLSIHISYPDNGDVRNARERGLDPGGAIMIHGQPNEPTRSEAYYRTQDWTNGCIAVSNSDMIDIWLMTRHNTPIEIRP